MDGVLRSTTPLKCTPCAKPMRGTPPTSYIRGSLQEVHAPVNTRTLVHEGEDTLPTKTQEYGEIFQKRSNLPSHTFLKNPASHPTRAVRSDRAVAAPTSSSQASFHGAQRPPRPLSPLHADPSAFPPPPSQERGRRQRSHVPRRVADRAGANGVQTGVVEVWGLAVVANSPLCLGKEECGRAEVVAGWGG